MPAPTQFQTKTVDGIVLDSRRAAVFPASATLVVADLHLGYAWAKRARGALLPVSVPDDTTDRLATLQLAHGAKRIVVLGDVIHEAVAVPVLERLLQDFCARLSPGSELVFCLGNHDRGLDKLLREWKLPVTSHREFKLGSCGLLHGDASPSTESDENDFQLDPPTGPRRIIGHEHPSIALDDGVTSRVKCPAFLVAEDLLVLPAFSTWAAGCEVGRQPFLGPLARAAKFRTAYACMGPRLLRLPLR
jgi:putative SbcD/Mre11-related phosphoesterase